MSVEQYAKAQIVAGFAGEDITNLPFSIPPNVAASAINTDYYRRSILKRKGFLRVDDRPMTSGSISIRENNAKFSGTMSIGAVAWAPTGSWAISFAVQMYRPDCDGIPKVMRIGTAMDSTGVTVSYDKTNKKFICEIGSSGGVKTLTLGNDSYANNVAVNLMVVYYVAQDGTKYYRFYQDATLVETTSATHTYSPPAESVVRFGYDSVNDQTMLAWIGEVRMWDLASGNDAAYNTWLDRWITDLSYKRQLTEAEKALPQLTKYYQFNLSEYVYNSGFNPTEGTGVFAIPVPTGSGSQKRDVAYGRGLVVTGYDADWPNSTALALWPSDFGEYWVRFGAEIWVHKDKTTNSPARYATRCCEFHHTMSGVPIKEAWSVCRYRNRLVAVHPHIGCFYLGDITGTPDTFGNLVPIPPDASGVTASDSGSGTGPGNGTYKFRFYYYNSDTGVHSTVSEDIVTVNMNTGNKIQLNNFDSIARERKPIANVDKLQIFRTTNGGNTFYLVDTVDLSSSPPNMYSSNAMNVSDANIIVSESEQALRYDLADRRPRRARACFEHRGYLILVAPNEQDEYTTAVDYRDTYNNAIMWSDPNAVHLFSEDNYKEILPDVADFLVGGISVPGGALLAKRYSLVAMYGEDPSTWMPRRISDHGCLAHNTLAASDTYVYMLSDKGIVRVAVNLSFGTAQNVTTERFKPIVDDIDLTKIGRACGVYHKAKRQYWVTFDTLSQGRITLVFHEDTGAIAKWDFDPEAYYVYKANDPDAAESKIMALWRGYIVQVDTSNTDGADINEYTTTLTGTITSATDQSFTDTSKNWPTASYYATVSERLPYASLYGLKVVVTKADGSQSQTRTITFNTATRAWVDSPWTFTPQAGDTYSIAGIQWHWKSVKFCPHGDPGELGVVRRLAVWKNPVTPTSTVNLDHWLDGTSVDQPATISNNSRFEEVLINASCREMEIKFENNSPNQPVEIEAFRVELQQKAVRP